METTKVLTSLLVLSLTGPTLAYPYTRGVVSRSSARARDHLDSSLADYLGSYTDQQYGLPEYQPTYRHEYVPRRQRINAEELAALLPYLTANNDDYAYDYSSYSDDDGTWYDDTANDDLSDNDNAALLQFLLDHRNGRYSLEDLETLEREAEMEDNTENQLHALMAKKINKKSNMPLLGARPIAIAAPLRLVNGQKEEALDIPSTSIRRPVFARQITTQPEETEPQAKRNIDMSSDSTQQAPTAVGKQAASVTNDVPASSSSSSSSSSSRGVDVNSQEVAQTNMSPFMQSKYDTLIKYLDRERKVRQNQDIEQELQQEIKPQPQKRFVTEQDSLSQQLANLKKKVA